MYGIFTYICLIFMVNAGKYTIHWVFGNVMNTIGTWNGFEKMEPEVSLEPENWWVSKRQCQVFGGSWYQPICHENSSDAST